VVDARVRAPGWCMTLTTSDPATGSARFRDGVHNVFDRRHGLRRWWEVEYFFKVEFTTGLAPTSGGHRRMHAHGLLKGLDGAELLNVEALTRERWAAVTGAIVVEVAKLRTPAAGLHYLGLHHAKASQLPPDEWRGMVERASRGYWSAPVAELRKVAQLELRAEALAWATTVDRETALWLVGQDGAAKAERREEVRRLREEARALAWMSGAPVVAESVAAIEQLGLWS
jgi:hypothetical protein